MLPSLSAPFAGWLAGHVVCPFRLRLPRTAAALVLLVCTVLYVSPSVLYVLVCSLLSLLSISSAHCSVRCSTRTCTCSSACLLVALLLVLSSSLVVLGLWCIVAPLGSQWALITQMRCLGLHLMLILIGLSDTLLALLMGWDL